MIRWLLVCLPLIAAVPVQDMQIYQEHDTQKKIDSEFSNFSTYAQPIQQKVFNATPTLNDLQDGEEVIVASNTWVTKMFRWNNDIWKVNASCSTVFR